MSGTPAVPFFSAPGAAFGVDLGDCLQRVVDSGWYVLGPQVRDFEAAFADYVGVSHTVGVANGTDAIRMAARNIDLPPGAVFHSDRGSNYTSDEYATTLKTLGITHSVGRTGICFDNALAESTNGAIKVELVNREQFPTREIATRKIANYIELYYNRRRLHSHLGYITPHEYLTQHTQPPTAA